MTVSSESVSRDVSPQRIAPGPAAGGRRLRLPRAPAVAILSGRGDAALALALAALLVAVAVVAGGGQKLRPTGIVEGLATLIGGGILAAALVLAPPRRWWGAPALALLTALAALTALSILWSVTPEQTWLATNDLLAYLAVFSAGVGLAWLAPRRADAVLGAVVLACVALCAWGLLHKVTPGWFAYDPYARLRHPFDYWNAVGCVAAIGAVALLWLGSRRTGPPLLRIAAFPLLGLVLLTLLLSYSRGSLLAAGCGAAVWFAVAPRRLRSAALLLPTAALTAIVAIWAFAQHGLADDDVARAAQASAGRGLGAVLIVFLVVLVAVGWLVERRAAHTPLTGAARQRAGRALALAGCCAPVLAVIALAAAGHDVGGTVSGAWQGLTRSEPNATAPTNQATRLASTSSVRGVYWHEAGRIWRAHKLTGVGAGGFATARLRYREVHDQLVAKHAHGYPAQMLAELGLLGCALSLALLCAWLATAARASGLRRRERGQPFTPERLTLAAFVAVVVAFGVHATIDWTWEIPGTAMLALLPAGFVAGRGRFGEPTAPPSRTPPRVRIAGAGMLVLIALVTAWTIQLPQRAASASSSAVDAADAGQIAKARAEIRKAHSRDPLALDPYYDEASVETAAGNLPGAARALEQAVLLHSADPDAWTQLGSFQLSVLHDPRSAVASLRAAQMLDPYGYRAQQRVQAAAAALQQQQQARAAHRERKAKRRAARQAR